MTTEPLRTRERGHVDLERDRWLLVSAAPGFWTLVDAGILKVSQPSRTTMRVSGTKYVGVARLGELDVQVEEKVPGSLACLIRFATADAFRIERVGTRESGFGSLTVLLIDQFLAGLRHYVSGGRRFVYGRQRAASPFVRGRLDVVETLRLRAKGMGHLVAYDRNIQDFRTELNLVLFAGLRQVEHLAKLIDIPHASVSTARSMALFFSDCRTTEILFASRRSWAERARRLTEVTREPAHRDLLALATVLLARQGFELADGGENIVPRAWFLNLEQLFEDAVRRLLRRTAPVGSTVRNGKGVSLPIFPGSLTPHKAEPDLLVHLPAGKCLVGDVKHKEWAGDANPGDLYQLLVHAQTYGSREAFLVYPGDAFEHLVMGQTVDGVRVHLARLDVRALDLDVERLAVKLGLIDKARSVA